MPHQHMIDPEVLRRDILALAKLSLEDLGVKKERRKSLTQAIADAVREFFGLEDAEVAKVGRKISAERLKVIKEALSQARAAADRLAALVKEVEEEPEPDSFTDHTRAKGGAEMKPEELQAAVEAAIKPVGERLDQITTRLDAVEKVVNKAADPPDKDKKDQLPAADAEAIKSAVAAATKPLEDRLAALDERLRGVERVATKSRQPEPDGDKSKVSQDPFGDAVRERREPVVAPHPGFRMPVRT
jgi:hypothetical protein